MENQKTKKKTPLYGAGKNLCRTVWFGLVWFWLVWAGQEKQEERLMAQAGFRGEKKPIRFFGLNKVTVNSWTGQEAVSRIYWQPLRTRREMETNSRAAVAARRGARRAPQIQIHFGV